MFKGGTAAAGATAEQDLPLSYARTLSWLSLLVIMATSLVLSFFIANSAREALLTRQENFSRLLAENLNHQIYRRFALPTLLAHGRIALRQPSQYDRLDQVVQSVVHGLPMERLRIYDFTRVVAYSTSKEELGRMGVGPESLDSTLRGGVPKPELISNIPDWRAIFHLPLPSGTFVLRTLYPLRGEPLQPGAEPPIMGALELTQDITSDYEQILLFQGVVVVTCLLSSVIMFALLLMLIQRAERVLADRMAKNRQLENELHSNEKLVSMGRVIASIAHEIRNPLGIIRSSSEFLIRRTPEQEKGSPAQRILTAIFDESCRLSQIVNDFLDYARPRVPRQDRVDLNALLNQATGFLDGEMKRLGVECVRDTEGSLFVLGDKDLLYRAVYNILVNAYQAIGTNGTIHIRGERRDDGMIALSFHDSGPGFPPALLHKLLDPFFTTKDHGTGLGLPIVNTIITSHNGKLLLTNPEEGGAMITILLPVASEPDIGDTPEKDERPAASADDEPVTLTDPLPSEKHDLREGNASPQTR